MMNNFSENITPDSFSGEIFAFEGIDNVITIVNGPSGCKFYHSATADYQTIKQLEFDPLNYPEQWYFGQPRVPCTYLDTKDYVYGSKEKLVEAISFLDKNVSFDLLCIVNSPGAALIGDNLKDIVASVTNKPFIAIESPGFSQSICDGYENATIQLIKQLGIKKVANKERKTVNIIGLSIFHKYHIGDIQELKRLFTLCDIDINCFICADCNLESLKNIPKATLNVVIHPEYGIKTAQFLEKEFATPFYVCDGAPIGFKATEVMMQDLSNLLDVDCTKLLLEGEKARAKAFIHISRVNSLTGLPDAIPYAIEGNYSEIYAYASFISKYFGMILESVSIENIENNYFKEKVDLLLDELKVKDIINYDILNTCGELVFANGNTIAKLKLSKLEFSGIEISLPTLGYLDVIAKTHLGFNGALLLTEQILNGLMFK